MDDNLLDLSEECPQIIYPKEIVQEFIHMADHVVTSTKLLAQRIAPLNPRVSAIKNTLNRGFMPEKERIRPASARFTVGYMGSYTHFADLELVAPAINHFVRQHQHEVRFEILGVCDRPELIKQLLPNASFSLLFPGENHRYPDFMPWFSTCLNWDLAIAPLHRGVFSDCKSDLKFLDYTACGCPGLYSDTPSYQSTVIDGQTGLLCGNSTDEWIDALNLAYLNKALRTSLYQNARKFVMKNSLNEQVEKDWLAVISTAMAYRRERRSSGSRSRSE